MAPRKTELVKGSFTAKEIKDIRQLKLTCEMDFSTRSNNNIPLEDPLIVVAGGYFTSRILKHKINDIDVFILAGNKYSDFLKIKYISVTSTKVNNHDYSNSNIHAIYDVQSFGYKIQYIFRKETTREELISGFDYEHSKVSYSMRQLFINPRTYRAIKNMKLIATPGITSKQKRTDKFLALGFTQALPVLNVFDEDLVA
jgi:hypothetical protein